MDVQQYLTELSQVNRNGFGFLLAYGVTWLVAAIATIKFDERVGAYTALFQGLVGLPFGLLITALTQTGPRPDNHTLNMLSIYLSMGQLMVLPVSIVLLTHRQHTLAVVVLAIGLAVHLVPYSWLYATPVYAVVASSIAVGNGIALARGRSDERIVAGICTICGGSLLLGSVGALLF